MRRESIDQATSPDGMDLGQALVRAAVSAVPVLGGPAVELMNFVVTPPLEARRNQWLNELAADLDALQERVDSFDIPSLDQNENFLSAIAVAVGTATRSAQAEKREMLRNAVLNTALGRVPDFDMQTVFIDYLEYLTPLHVQLLRVFVNPGRALKDAGSDLEQRTVSGSPSLVVEELFPNLRGRSDVYTFLWHDLYQRRLVESESLGGMMTSGGIVSSRTTKLGRQFIEYLGRPPEVSG